MAKKKHKKRRHRRVGAFGMKAGSPLTMALSVGAGYFADQFIGVNSLIDSFLPGTVTTPATATTPAIHVPTATMNNIAMAGEIGLGGYLLLSKKKSTVKTVAGGVLAGLGVRRLLKEMKIISGFQGVPVIGGYMRGFQNTPVIGGGMPNALSGGYPSSLSGYVARNGLGSYIPIGSGSRVMGSVDGGSGLSSGSGYME
jgi:hypothetical protein